MKKWTGAFSILALIGFAAGQNSPAQAGPVHEVAAHVGAHLHNKGVRWHRRGVHAAKKLDHAADHTSAWAHNRGHHAAAWINNRIH